MIDFVVEFYSFLKAQKKIWMLPILFVLISVGGLLMLAQGSVIAPFIYTLF